MQKQNWYDTLNQALDSENLIDSWDIHNTPIEYGETRKFINLGRLVSIYRNNQGRYERPVHYPA